MRANTTSRSANPFLAVDRRIVGDAGTSGEVRRTLYTLCDEIGSRFAGTDGYRLAAEYMLGRFKAYGLATARLEPFEFVAWRRGAPARLHLTAPRSREVPCLALPHGAATGPEGLEAGWVDVGGGSAAEIDACGRRLPGRFALTDGSSGHRRDVLMRCAAAGSAGLLLGNRMEGMQLQTGSVGGEGAEAIPAVSIAFETLCELRRLAAGDHGRLRLVTDGRCEPATTWNVVGELPGGEHPDELVVMGGHLDSHDISPGAFDNGAGAVMVMEAARLLARHRRHLKRTIRFIGFAAEEVGLLGSHHHARTHAAALQKARFMLNCDTPALGRPHGLAFHGCPKAAGYVAGLAAQMDAEIPCHDRQHCHSDHYPFILQGVPTAGIAGGSAGSRAAAFVHRYGDTPEKLAVEDLRDAAAFAARFLLRAANDEHWPAMRRGAAEIRAWKAKGDA